MSFSRAANSAMAASACAAIKFAASAPSPAMRRCPQCFRMFSPSKPFQRSSRRQLQTAAAYQPSSLKYEPLPRNSNVPDTSIAGETPAVTETRSPRPIEQRVPTSAPGQEPTSTVSIPEREAQKSKPVASAAATGPSTRPKRSKLRPRKAAMTLTPTAVEQLRDLLDQPDPKLIRVGVKNRGCSGLAYHLEYVDKPGAFDETVEQDGVKVLIDSKALFSIIGSEMDWVEDKLSRRFVFKNPNITEQCGCGESFSIS